MNRVSHVLNHLSPQLRPDPVAYRRYECTLDSSSHALTQEQRDFYEENGFLVIRNLLNKSDIRKFWNRFDELVENPDTRREEMTVMRDVSEKDMSKKSTRAVTKLQVWSRDPVLWQFASHPRIVRYVEAFTGPDVRAMHFMMINKPPDAGTLSSRHPLHQDLWYFPFGPPDRVVCAWTALEKVHRRNGCLCVIPGSHKSKQVGRLVPHGYPKEWEGRVNKAYHSVQVDDVMKLVRNRIHLEMDEGDTVFFHPLLVHGSGANLTAGFRRSISVHYSGSGQGCHYYPLHIPEQEKIATEIEQMARIRGISFEEVWKYKSRQVKGNPGRLGHPVTEAELQADFCESLRQNLESNQKK